MKIRVSLDYVKNAENVLHPFWFTVDKSIHLNLEHPTVEVELDGISAHTLHEIYSNVVKGVIKVSDNKVLQDAIEEARNPKEETTEPIPIPEPAQKLFIEKDEVVEEPVVEETTEEVVEEVQTAQEEFIITEEMNELLSKNYRDVIKTIGSDKLEENGELKPGIADIAKLEELIKAEEIFDKTPRKSVIAAAEKRIEAIKSSNGFMSEAEPELTEITPENLITEARK